MTATERLLAMDVERKGRFGEAVCESVMKSSGVTYIPLCRIETGNAPMAVAAGGKTVLPDFDVFGGGVQAYLDAKVKTQSIRYRRTGEVRHGINLSNYKAYERMGAIGSKQCGLFVVELTNEDRQWSGTLLCESFAGLGKEIRGFNEPTPKVYWPRKRFANIGSYSAEQLIEIANGNRAVDMSALLTAAFAAPKPRCSDSEHNNPAVWRDEPERDRRGFIRTVCRKCDAFIGYRPGN